MIDRKIQDRHIEVTRERNGKNRALTLLVAEDMWTTSDPGGSALATLSPEEARSIAKQLLAGAKWLEAKRAKSEEEHRDWSAL